MSGKYATVVIAVESKITRQWQFKIIL